MDIPFRVRLGVTGHRNLNAGTLPSLSGRIAEALTRGIDGLFACDPGESPAASTRAPVLYTLLTPLAEGADRVVAQEVLKTPGATLEVILPMMLADYMEDFETTESRQEFQQLIGNSRRPTTLRDRLLREEFTQDELPAARREAYEQVGRFIVDSCDVLIAVWDGQAARGRGGTAEIVAYALDRGRPTIVISTSPPHEINTHVGHGLSTELIVRIEEFNKEEIRPEEEQVYIDNYSKDLFDSPEGGAITQEAKALGREKLLPFYVRASRIAKKNQKRYLRAGMIVYGLSALALTSVAVAVVKTEWSVYAYVAELLSLMTIFVSVLRTNRMKVQEKWIENRFLAERIRTALFFVASRVEVSPIGVPPYMRLAHGPDDWMVRVFTEIWSRLPSMPGCGGHSHKDLADYIRRHWIDDQIRFHRSKSSASGNKYRHFERDGKVVFAVAIVAALVHVVLLHFAGLHSPTVDRLATLLAVSMPAIGAALAGIAAHREYVRHEKRSENMARALEELGQRYGAVKGHRDLESLLRETEELMLRETQDWLMLMRPMILHTTL